MDFRDEHVFNAPIDAVWDMFSDPDSHTTKFESMGHRDIEVLEADSSESGLHMKVRRVVDVELPGFAKKFLKPTNTVTTTDAQGRAQVSAGKYLNDRTYLELKQDPETGGGKAAINLDIGRGVKLRGEAGSNGAGAAGIFYEKEY